MFLLHSRRFTKPMSIVVFGIYCREDEEVIFLRVNGKEKRDMRPCVVRHCDPDTKSSARTRQSSTVVLKKLIHYATHETTNHKKCEFVSKTDVRSSWFWSHFSNRQTKNVKRPRYCCVFARIWNAMEPVVCLFQQCLYRAGKIRLLEN